MTLFITPQYTASFSQEPHVGEWLLRKFYQWKIEGSNNPPMFGRDKVDERPGYENLWHTHIIPSAKEEQEQWLRDAKTNDKYYLTSDRFLLYAQHQESNSFLLIRYYKDTTPGGHKGLTGYYGKAQDNFSWALQVPDGCTVFPPGSIKTAS